MDTYIKRGRGKLDLGNKAELAYLAHRLNSEDRPDEFPGSSGLTSPAAVPTWPGMPDIGELPLEDVTAGMGEPV